MAWLLASQWLWMIGLVAGNYAEFPNPQKEFRLCGRRNASFVCDPEFILDMGDVERLDHLAQAFRKSTNCLCSKCETGISVGIFVRRNITQESQKLYPDGKKVAEMLRRRWSLGKCSDDIVIILLTDMNISDYSIGPTVQEIFPDATAQLIMKDCRVHFLSGWYYQGLESVVSSFNDVVIRLQKQKKSSTSLIVGISLGIGVFFILIVISIVLLRRQSKRRKEGCDNIYASVPTRNKHDKYLNEKRNEYQLEKLHKQVSSDEDEEGYMSDEDTNLNIPSRLIQIQRQLSAVTEESSDDNEGFKDVPLNALSNSHGTNRSLQVTEL